MRRDTIRDILYRNSLARFVEDIEAASREGKSVLDVILPNGKRLGDCLLKQAQSYGRMGRGQDRREALK